MRSSLAMSTNFSCCSTKPFIPKAEASRLWNRQRPLELKQVLNALLEILHGHVARSPVRCRCEELAQVQERGGFPTDRSVATIEPLGLTEEADSMTIIHYWAIHMTFY